jgi:hypothetical protein
MEVQYFGIQRLLDGKHIFAPIEALKKILDHGTGICEFIASIMDMILLKLNIGIRAIDVGK